MKNTFKEHLDEIIYLAAWLIIVAIIIVAFVPQTTL